MECIVSVIAIQLCPQSERSQRQYVNKWAWFYSHNSMINKALFIKGGGRPDLACET